MALILCTNDDTSTQEVQIYQSCVVGSEYGDEAVAWQVMFMTDSNNIKEVLLFPAMKPQENN